MLFVLLAGPFITSFAMGKFGITNLRIAGFPVARSRSEISTSPIF
jgi:hypothetical protein